eukprot:1232982-Pyramimonas_sp.AAC.2
MASMTVLSATVSLAVPMSNRSIDISDPMDPWAPWPYGPSWAYVAAWPVWLHVANGLYGPMGVEGSLPTRASWHGHLPGCLRCPLGTS